MTLLEVKDLRMYFRATGSPRNVADGMSLLIDEYIGINRVGYHVSPILVRLSAVSARVETAGHTEW